MTKNGPSGRASSASSNRPCTSLRQQLRHQLNRRPPHRVTLALRRPIGGYPTKKPMPSSWTGRAASISGRLWPQCRRGSVQLPMPIVLGKNRFCFYRLSNHHKLTVTVSVEIRAMNMFIVSTCGEQRLGDNPCDFHVLEDRNEVLKRSVSFNSYS